MDASSPGRADSRMPKFRFRAWRKFRRLNQTQLAIKCGMSTANYSRIETNAQAFTRDTLLEIAKALECEPFHLVGPFDPGTPEHSLIEELRGMTPDRRARIVRLVRAVIESQAA